VYAVVMNSYARSSRSSVFVKLLMAYTACKFRRRATSG
jgi:hypothetical protein